MALGNLILTRGEILFILRRRNGCTQSIAGEVIGVNRYEYGKIERDMSETKLIPDSRPLVFSQLSDSEKCTLIRKREGVTQKELASTLSMSRFWINQMELGRADPCVLVSFWEKK